MYLRANFSLYLYRVSVEWATRFAKQDGFMEVLEENLEKILVQGFGCTQKLG